MSEREKKEDISRISGLLPRFPHIHHVLSGEISLVTGQVRLSHNAGKHSVTYSEQSPSGTKAGPFAPHLEATGNDFSNFTFRVHAKCALFANKTRTIFAHGVLRRDKLRISFSSCQLCYAARYKSTLNNRIIYEALTTRDIRMASKVESLRYVL